MFAGRSYCVQVEGEEPIDYTADKITYVQEKKIVKGEGNVIITYKGMSLRADRMIVHLETQDIYADGNVVFNHKSSVFTGEKVHFNYRTMMGDFLNGSGFVDPWYGKGETISKTGENEFQVSEGFITTCDYQDPHYRLGGKKIYIYPGDRIIARDVVVFVGNTPVLWAPFYNRSLRDERERLSIVPGYNKRFGGFVRTGINFWIDPYLTGTIRNDYYTKRGYGFGVDGQYRLPFKIENFGDIKTYFIRDGDYHPTDPYNRDFGKNRWRVAVNHEMQVFPDTRAVGQLRLQSDPDIINDFFRDEFEREIQPENYIDITKSTQNYSLTLFARKRMNDIFTELERLPDLRFILTKQNLFNTGIYYTTEDRMSYLNYVPDHGDNYDAFRMDSYHQLSYPFKFLRFLNLEPFVSYRGTYYNKGVNDKNLLRSIFGTGLDALTKIHKTFPHVQNEFWQINQLRHVIESRITYTYRHDPTEEPVDLYQFDDIDAIDRRDDIRFSLRNLLQTKRKNETVNLIDFEIYTFFHPEKRTPAIHRIDYDEYSENYFSDIFYFLRLRPLDWIAVDCRVSQDPYEQRFDSVDTDAQILYGDNLNVSFRHRFVRTYDDEVTVFQDDQVRDSDLHNLVGGEIIYRFNSNWVFKIFVRYDFGLNKLETQEYSVFRDLHCWQVALTFRQRPLRDDLSAFIVMRLKAYPEVPIKIGN
ncbi:LPS-assembly protein LptD [Candidatus Auribacterota bacterium]